MYKLSLGLNFTKQLAYTLLLLFGKENHYLCSIYIKVVFSWCRYNSGNMWTMIVTECNFDVINSLWHVVRWKVHESALLGIGSLSKLILEHVSTNKLPLDINTFLQNVVMVDLNQNGECCEMLLSSSWILMYLLTASNSWRPRLNSFSRKVQH